MTQARIFLSAVTSEFRNARSALTDEFGTRGRIICISLSTSVVLPT